MQDSAVPNQGVGRLLLPLYIAYSRKRLKLVGSAFVYTVSGRFFIVTAAHVANILRNEQPALRGRTQYVFVDTPFYQTTGDQNDRFDIAIAEMHPSVFAMLGDSVEFADLSCITQDFVIAEGMPVAFLGFPRSVNKKRVWSHQIPAVVLQQSTQVAFSHPVYAHRCRSVHICATFRPSDRFLIGSIPCTSPDPNGMSGGLVCRLNVDDYNRGQISFKGIIGIGIEYDRDARVLIGTHISAFFELLRSRCPSVSSKIPFLQLETGEYLLTG
jgi:hypothetical protein